MVQLRLATQSAPTSPIVDSKLTFEKVRHWTWEQVSHWLQENNFKEYERLFAENDINGDVLLELDHQILKELQIRSIGDRIRLLAAVRMLLKACSANVHNPYKDDPPSPTSDKKIPKFRLKFLKNVARRQSKDLCYTPETLSFPVVPLARSSSLSNTVSSKSLKRSNSAGSPRTPNTPKSPQSNKVWEALLQSKGLSFLKMNNSSNDGGAANDNLKQHFIKVISESQTKTINIQNANDAKSIFAKVLAKFNITDEVEKYSLFVSDTHSEAAHKLKDEELVEICRDPDRPERNRLVLRKIHQHLSHEDYMRIRQNRKLQRFFGEKVPTTPQGFSQKKLRNFFGQRPPSELISLNLTEYFPGHNSEELERSHRMSMRRASRPSGPSRPSRPKSRTVSALYDNESLSSSSSSFTLVPSVQGDDCSCHELPILEEERNNEFQVMEDEEVEENWNPDADADTDSTDTSGLTPFKWIKGALIGSGSFGNVYLGLNSATGELMAVKQVELPTGQSANEDRKKSMLDALQREITLLKELDHENIVRYLGSQHDEKSLNIFLEYVPGGSVSSMLRNYGPQEETLVRSFVRQILTGLNYLHERDIIHRDIKGANILVDNKGGIKISDFGISKKVEDEFMAATSAHRPSLQGSVYWMAPEVVKQTHYTTKADIWSLGCLIVEMFTGEHPFPTLHQMQAMFKIGLSCAPEIPDNISHDATDFLRLTFEADHVSRPPASVLQDHPFVTTTLKPSPQPSP